MTPSIFASKEYRGAVFMRLELEHNVHGRVG